jgi:hypothetical protein
VHFAHDSKRPCSSFQVVAKLPRPVNYILAARYTTKLLPPDCGQRFFRCARLGAILAWYRRLMCSYVDHCDGCHPHFYWLIRGGRIRLDPPGGDLKTAGRKAMQVRLLSPPPFLFQQLTRLIRSHSIRSSRHLARFQWAVASDGTAKAACSENRSLILTISLLCFNFRIARDSRRSSNECIGDFESTEEAFCCLDFRVTTWALGIDPPFAKLIRGSWFG